jgi:hypothetical protein
MLFSSRSDLGISDTFGIAEKRIVAAGSLPLEKDNIKMKKSFIFF